MEAFDFSDVNAWLTLLTKLGIAIAIFAVGWMISRTAHRVVLNVMRRRISNEALARFSADIVRYLVLAFAVIASLDKAGVPTTSLAAVLGAAGFAVGMALQGNLSNFASGVMILFFKPFEIGDIITAGGETGQVQDIGLFATTMQTPDNHTIIVSNSGVLGGTITNYTKLGKQRSNVDVGVAYGVDIDAVMAVLEKAAYTSEVVLDDEPVVVAFVNMAASAIEFKVHFWTEALDFVDGMHQVRVACYKALNEADIEIPFDQIVVHQAPAEG